MFVKFSVLIRNGFASDNEMLFAHRHASMTARKTLKNRLAEKIAQNCVIFCSSKSIRWLSMYFFLLKIQKLLCFNDTNMSRAFVALAMVTEFIKH